MKKYIVNIEQPMLGSFEVEAENEEQAHEIARQKYHDQEFVIDESEFGTDTQIEVCDADGNTLVDWTTL